MALRRRSLYPGCDDGWSGSGCSSSPPSPHSYHAPSPSPSPSPSSRPYGWFPSCPPTAVPAGSPSPAHGARRDQGGTHGYSPGGDGGADHHRRIITIALVVAAVLAFVSLILLGVSVTVRRRQVRRRRQALLAAAPATAANFVGGGGDDPEGGAGGGVVHHVWYIRTVGLDEAAINSISVTRYRAGAGLLGAADCSVCLGEFQDGELVRLLPKCGHAFHVPCIDTWLRAHVNCPLCRSDVLDPAGASVAGGEPNPIPEPDPVANANAEQAPAASDAVLVHEEEEDDQEQEALHAEEDHHHEQPISSPEPLPPRLPCPPPPWNVRRTASMDAALVSVATADVAALERPSGTAPEEEQQGGGRRQKHRSGAKVSGSGHQSSLGGAAPRSFFSRHCRARSSVLPL